MSKFTSWIVCIFRPLPMFFPPFYFSGLSFVVFALVVCVKLLFSDISGAYHCTEILASCVLHSLLYSRPVFLCLLRRSDSLSLPCFDPIQTRFTPFHVHPVFVLNLFLSSSFCGDFAGLSSFPGPPLPIAYYF